MTFLAVCPFVHRPSFDAMFAGLAPELARDALVIDNTVTNLGAAGSRNVGARRILDEGIDWLVDISPATRFGQERGLDFIDHLDDAPDAWVVQSSTPVNWHLIAWSRRMFERVGLFDENYWPVYGEDGDISRRIHLAAEHDEVGDAWRCVDSDAWITMYGHSSKLAGIEPDHHKIWSYYKSKWGGLSGHETYTHPFNDMAAPLSFWPVPPDKRSIIGTYR